MPHDPAVLQDTALRFDPEAIVQPASLGVNSASFSTADRQLLRQLAGQVAELAARPQEADKRRLWQQHNDLLPVRPLVFCDPENSWNEIIPQDDLRCSGELARQWEWHLRREIFWGTQMGDDRSVEPFFDVPHIYQGPDWGLRETRHGGQDGGSYVWDAPVQSEADLQRLHYPCLRVDYPATQDRLALAQQIFGDLLTVRQKTIWWWSLGMTWTLVNLRGLQQIILDMVEHPDLLHRLMSLLRDGTLAMILSLEAKGLISLNNDATYVGSGGFGWTRQLPQADFSGQVRLKDMWGFGESQETVGVSPRMYAEFVLPYQLPILSRFGLNCYGCCEPLDQRWQYVRQIPRLRRVSISPWSDREKMAQALGKDYIFSMKPNPADLAMDDLDEPRLRLNLRHDLEVTRGCQVEVIMKDNHTIRNDPRRVIRWVQIVREEIERL